MKFYTCACCGCASMIYASMIAPDVNPHELWCLACDNVIVQKTYAAC